MEIPRCPGHDIDPDVLAPALIIHFAGGPR
jgi:hypothetical protein